jgi:hypothetical protein
MLVLLGYRSLVGQWLVSQCLSVHELVILPSSSVLPCSWDVDVAVGTLSSSLLAAGRWFSLLLFGLIGCLV